MSEFDQEPWPTKGRCGVVPFEEADMTVPEPDRVSVLGLQDLPRVRAGASCATGNDRDGAEATKRNVEHVGDLLFDEVK